MWRHWPPCSVAQGSQIETSGFKWKLWISLPERWGTGISGCAAPWQCREMMETPQFLGDVQRERSDLYVRALVPGGAGLSSQLVPFPPQARYPSAKQTEKFPCLGRWQAALLYFLTVFFLGEAGAREPMGHGRGDAEWHPESTARGTDVIAQNVMEEQCHSTQLSINKLLLLFSCCFYIWFVSCCHDGYHFLCVLK